MCADCLLQMEAEQQLAALQSHSQMPVQSRWAGPSPTSFQALAPGHMNGFASPDTHMGSQASGPVEDTSAARRQLMGRARLGLELDTAY